MTALIDILLVLVIIFMVIPPIKPSSFDVRIPRNPTNDVDVLPDATTLVVSYGFTGGIQINHDKTQFVLDDAGDLSKRLRSIFDAREAAANPQRTVFIKTQPGRILGRRYASLTR